VCRTPTCNIWWGKSQNGFWIVWSSNADHCKARWWDKGWGEHVIDPIECSNWAVDIKGVNKVHLEGWYDCGGKCEKIIP